MNQVMGDMDGKRLRHDLASAAAHVLPSTALADRITGSARRRHRRRRLLGTGAMVLVVLAVATGTVALWRGDGSTQLADSRLTQPTRGDLAGDQAFLTQVTSTWTNELGGRMSARAADVQGTPHVYWAGTTPAGRAAVVLHQVRPRQAGTWSTLVGLVGTDVADGRFTVLGLDTETFEPGVGFIQGAGAFLFGRDDRTLLVMERGATSYLSGRAVVGPDGRPARSWQALPPGDGASVVALPDDAVPTEVWVRFGDTAPDPSLGQGSPPIASHEQVLAGGGTLGWTPPERRLTWTGDVRPIRVGSAREHQAEVAGTFEQALRQAGVMDPLTRTYGHSFWYVLAGLPDGRTAILGELQQDASPSQLWTVVLAADGTVESVLWGGQVDPAAALPVAVRMPDAQGWVVAAYGSTLRYRTAPGGPWVDAGQNAALLPEAAVEVEVTAPGAGPVVITL